jgi:hypothetical protein
MVHSPVTTMSGLYTLKYETEDRRQKTNEILKANKRLREEKFESSCNHISNKMIIALCNDCGKV